MLHSILLLGLKAMCSLNILLTIVCSRHRIGKYSFINYVTVGGIKTKDTTLRFTTLLNKMALENISNIPEVCSCSSMLRIAPRALHILNFLGGGPMYHIE